MMDTVSGKDAAMAERQGFHEKNKPLKKMQNKATTQPP